MHAFLLQVQQTSTVKYVQYTRNSPEVRADVRVRADGSKINLASEYLNRGSEFDWGWLLFRPLVFRIIPRKQPMHHAWDQTQTKVS